MDGGGGGLARTSSSSSSAAVTVLFGCGERRGCQIGRLTRRRGVLCGSAAGGALVAVTRPRTQQHHTYIDTHHHTHYTQAARYTYTQSPNSRLGRLRLGLAGRLLLLVKERLDVRHGGCCSLWGWIVVGMGGTSSCVSDRRSSPLVRGWPSSIWGHSIEPLASIDSGAIWLRRRPGHRWTINSID